MLASKILDWLLGSEIGTVYNRERLMELIRYKEGKVHLISSVTWWTGHFTFTGSLYYIEIWKMRVMRVKWFNVLEGEVTGQNGALRNNSGSQLLTPLQSDHSIQRPGDWWNKNPHRSFAAKGEMCKGMIWKSWIYIQYKLLKVFLNYVTLYKLKSN